MAVTAQRQEGVGGGVGSQADDAVALVPLRGVPEPALTHVHRPRLHRLLERAGRQPEIDGPTVVGLHVLKAPPQDLVELVDVSRLECGQ